MDRLIRPGILETMYLNPFELLEQAKAHLKLDRLQRKDEISLGVNVAKAEKIIKMTYAEIKIYEVCRLFINAKCFKNGQSAAKLRIGEGSTTMNA